MGHIERISPEAPVPILSITHRTSTLGGAGNVAENLRHWGVEVSLMGVVGQDETGRAVYDLLRAHGINAKGVLTEPSRKTTHKARLMSVEHGQQVFRVDEESTFTVSDEIEKGLIGAIKNWTRASKPWCVRIIGKAFCLKEFWPRCLKLRARGHPQHRRAKGFKC